MDDSPNFPADCFMVHIPYWKCCACNMHVTHTSHAFMTVTLMLHTCTISVYGMNVTVMVICMSHARNMSVEVHNMYGAVMLTCMVHSSQSSNMNVTCTYTIK